MSKEITSIDNVNFAKTEEIVQFEIVKLDDLSLALVGGGNSCVAL